MVNPLNMNRSGGRSSSSRSGSKRSLRSRRRISSLSGGGLDVHEPPVELHLEVAVELRVRIGHGQHQRIVDDEVDPVDPLQNQLVGVEDPKRAHHGRVEVHPAAEGPVFRAQVPLEGRRGVEALELERDENGRELLLEEGRREDTGHDYLDELLMTVDDAEIRDGAQELGHLGDLVADGPDEDPFRGGIVAELLFPEPQQRGQGQLALERKRAGVAAAEGGL
jgi:hypothetical protein